MARREQPCIGKKVAERNLHALRGMKDSDGLPRHLHREQLKTPMKISPPKMASTPHTSEASVCICISTHTRANRVRTYKHAYTHKNTPTAPNLGKIRGSQKLRMYLTPSGRVHCVYVFSSERAPHHQSLGLAGSDTHTVCDFGSVWKVYKCFEKYA